MTYYSTYNIIKALDIPRERLRSWMKDEFIVPSIKADGQGTKALFNIWDVYGVAIFQDLLNTGLTRKFAGDFVGGFIDETQKDPEIRPAFLIVWQNSSNGEIVDSIVISNQKNDKAEHIEMGVDLSTGKVVYRQSKKYRKWLLDRGVQRDEISYNFSSIPKELGLWTHIHIIDITAIRKRVDARLADIKEG